MAPKITPPKGLLVDIAAWQAEVMALRAPAIACGSLLLLKMHLWRIGPIPNDDVALARITATSPAEWRKLRKSIEPLFVVRHGEWMRQDWIDELEEAYAAVNRAKKRSQKGHAARWGRDASGNASSNATGTASGMLNNIGDAQPAQQRQKPQTPPSQGEGFSGQPDFEADVEIAEAALGIGGAA